MQMDSNDANPVAGSDCEKWKVTEGHIWRLSQASRLQLSVILRY